MRLFLMAGFLLTSGFIISVPAQEPVTIDKPGLEPNTRVKRAINDAKAKPQPQGYELRCRGGLATQDFQKVSERTDSSGEVIYTMTMALLADTDRAAGADSSGLRPGFCSWLDRPMNRNEAFYSNTGIARKLLYFETSANAQLKQKLHGSAVDTSPTAAERYPDAQTIPNYMTNASHYWSFFGGFRDGNFHASSHQAWIWTAPSYDVKPGQRATDILKKP